MHARMYVHMYVYGRPKWNHLNVDLLYLHTHACMHVCMCVYGTPKWNHHAYIHGLGFVLHEMRAQHLSMVLACIHAILAATQRVAGQWCQICPHTCICTQKNTYVYLHTYTYTRTDCLILVGGRYDGIMWGDAYTSIYMCCEWSIIPLLRYGGLSDFVQKQPKLQAYTIHG